MHITTSRLLIREFVEADLDAIVSYESEPLVVQYVCYGPLNRAECQQELHFHLQQQHAQPRIFYHTALVQAETQHMIGWCGIKIRSQTDQEGELGFALHPSYWGYGYATEAAQACMRLGFQELHLHRIAATCDPHNHGSVRVLEKIGMRYEGCLREHRWCKGKWRSSAVYALLATDAF